MLSRRKFFGLAAGAAIAPKELLAAPVAPTGAITLESLQKAYAAAKFDIAYEETDAAMVFEPKFYGHFMVIESTSEGREGFWAWEHRRRSEEMAALIRSISC